MKSIVSSVGPIRLPQRSLALALGLLLAVSALAGAQTWTPSPTSRRSTDALQHLLSLSRLVDLLSTGPARELLTNQRAGHKLLVMSIQEIEAAIAQLPAQEVDELMVWLEEYHAQMWDRQIERDLETGRLDDLLSEVDKEYEAGLAEPL